MTVVTIHKAKTELSKLIARVEAGEEIILARGDKPVVKLVPIVDDGAKSKRRPGALSHLRDKIPSDLFLQPMSEEDLATWEGRYPPVDNSE
jgi:prevent-host-death family protein